MLRIGLTLLALVMLPWPSRPLSSASLGENDRSTRARETRSAKAGAERAYDLGWWSVDCGGAESSGGEYALTATAGQADTGSSAHCSTVVDGGLWAGPIDRNTLFCDGFESGDTSAWSSGVGTGP